MPDLDTKHGDRTERERDLYQSLLDLGDQDEPSPFVDRALRVVVEAVGVQRGYLELRGDGDRHLWCTAVGMAEEDVDRTRRQISEGIVSAAISTGDTITTASAMLDPRFETRASVQAKKLEAVLCAPIAGDAAIGVIYLEGRRRPGPFTAEDREWAELFARYLTPFAERILARAAIRDRDDAVRPYRDRLSLEGMVGRSPALAQALREASLAAPLDISVLITGPSGTGKSELARVIHRSSPRRNQPFVEVNCAALPEGLIENELFGAIRGSHSAANRDALGKVQAAQHGTLLLDEVAELPLSAQAKLHQLLQERAFYPLGATQPVSIDLRVIAATNVDLQLAVENGSFREDLLFRLQGMPIRMPALSERPGDLPELSAHLVAEACRSNGLGDIRLSRAALNAISAADWPGNVRQLANSLTVGAVRAAGSNRAEISVNDVFPDASIPETQGMTFQQATRQFQRGFLMDVLEDTNWNVSEAARRLDLARSHVYNLIRLLGIDRTSR